MGDLVTFMPLPIELICECGSVWFTTKVQFDGRTSELIGYSLSHVRCNRCGADAPIVVGGQS